MYDCSISLCVFAFFYFGGGSSFPNNFYLATSSTFLLYFPHFSLRSTRLLKSRSTYFREVQFFPTLEPLVWLKLLMQSDFSGQNKIYAIWLRREQFFNILETSYMFSLASCSLSLCWFCATKHETLICEGVRINELHVALPQNTNFSLSLSLTWYTVNLSHTLFRIHTEYPPFLLTIHFFYS